MLLLIQSDVVRVHGVCVVVCLCLGQLCSRLGLRELTLCEQDVMFTSAVNIVAD